MFQIFIIRLSILYFIYFSLAVPGLRFCEKGLLSSCGVQAPPRSGFSGCRAQALQHVGFSRLWGLGSVVVVPGLQSTGSVVVARGLICSTARGIFPDQGLKPRLLHWQADCCRAGALSMQASAVAAPGLHSTQTQ